MAVDQVPYTRYDVAVPGIVEHAWVTRPGGAHREILLPDGRGLLQLVVGGAATTIDATSGDERADASGVRGLMTRPAVRVADGGGVRMGVQLHPTALETLGAAPLVDVWAPAQVLVGERAVEEATAALRAADDEGAVRILVDALVARAAARAGAREPERERFAEVVARIDALHGAVTVAELARFVGVTVSDVFRWSQRYLGVVPADYLAAVRFSVFVRRAVGPGVVDPEAVLAALRWYAGAGFAPREVERTAGMGVDELRRVEERIASWVGARSV